MRSFLDLALLASALLASARPASAQLVPTALQGVQDPGVVVPPQGSLRVSASTRVKPGEYVRPPVGDAGQDGVIVLEGLTGVTLDLGGVRLYGQRSGTPLDQSTGYGIVLRDCEDVTVRGGEIGGYKGCLVASGCRGLRLEGVRFERWYGQRLLSSVAAENEADRLVPFEDDRGTWLERYGAAISLSDCTDVEITDCSGRRGQNGILLARTSGARIHGNDFSFLSGWGLVLSASNANVVHHNAFDYCVRGFSHGIYWGGQGSAGMLLSGPCADNVFAYNSATHSGNGLLLVAGVDLAGAGPPAPLEALPAGSSGNHFFQNDFSYAVASGIEATFAAGDRFVENVVRGCHQHGFRGRYARELALIGNALEDTLGGALTLEHARDCIAYRNVVQRNRVGIGLYWDGQTQLGVPGQELDTTSRGHVLLKNAFSENDSDLQIRNTSTLLFSENVFDPDNRPIHTQELVSAAGAQRERSELLGWMQGIGGWAPSGLIAGSSLLPPDHPRLEELARSGVLEVAPPKVPLDLPVVAPGARARQGLDTIVLGEWGPWDFVGGEPRPEPRLPGGALAEARWAAKWFSWADGPDPRGSPEDLERWRGLTLDPLATATVTSWYSPIAGQESVRERVGDVRFGLIATARVTLQPGRYRLATVSDDGIRILVDDEPVLENWTWHAPVRDEAYFELEGGEHLFRLEYFQIDAGSALCVELEAIGP
jgi:hypothetical protein